MSERPVPRATPLVRTVDLAAALNASDADVAARFHPRYAQALERLPGGPSVFRGLPFALAPRSSGRRWILLDGEVSIDLRCADDGAPPGDSAAGPGPSRLGRPSHLVVAHFSDSWRDGAGERLPGTPVGWVLPAGQPLATYELRLADGSTRSVPIRRRFEIDDGIIGWGFLPFEAVGHRADEAIDWRGPHPRQATGRYAPAGHAGPLTMLPGAWGPDQTGVADFVPTPEDDITYWLHAIPLAEGEDPVALRLVPVGNGSPGTSIVVAGLTLFHGTGNPLAWAPRRQLGIEGSGDTLAEVDLGVAIRARPPVRMGSASGTRTADATPLGWGSPRRAEDVATAGSVGGTDGSARPAEAVRSAIVDLTAAPDARILIDGWELPLADVDASGTASNGRITIRALPAADIRVAVRITADGEPTPARVRFVAADGRYLPPLGHRDEINPGLMEDTGADILLGDDAYAYVAGEFTIDLPPGDVDMEVVKGFDLRPVRMPLVVGKETRDLAIEMERVIDLEGTGWRTSDSHVHFLSPATALLQAAAEDVTFVHLLATQWGDQYTSTQDLPWGSQHDPAGRHAVIVGTENRQNMLGHVALLGARRPVIPMAAGGAPEGRLGGAVDELLGDWADRCHAAGGLVVGAHFPLPYAEIAADIVSGRIDAVEMQCFAPGLDNPSIVEWYRFLNCGYRLPVVGGTDKMSAEVPVGAIRTYARLDPNAAPTFDSWAAAVRAGRTFATSGPVIELAVDGHEPGEVIALGGSGGRLEVRARARAAQAVIGCVEIIMNGRVVAVRDAAAPVNELAVDAALEVRSGAWIAARSRSDHEIHSAFTTTMASHSSPVYVEVADHPLFVAADAEVIGEVIDGTARWLETMAAIADPAQRARMVEWIVASGDTLRARIARQRGGGLR